MKLHNPSMAHSVYEQLDRANQYGITAFATKLPVVDTTPVRIGLVCPKDLYETHSFAISMSRHPSGPYSIGVESEFGMTLGVPALFRKGVEEISCTETQGFETLHVVVDKDKIAGYTTDFDGNSADLVGLSELGQELLSVQLAGLILRKSLHGAIALK